MYTLLNVTNYFYFSYDDSASTVAVELAKYQLNNDILPSSTLARPWEYLNYESFDPSSPESIGLFTVSMGLMKRSSFDDQNISEYHLGVYIQSPGITKEERQNVALTLIVDVSGSMDEKVSRVEEVRTTRLELVKYALNKLVDSLKQGDIVNLVTFSTEAEILLENIQYSQIPDVFIPAVDNLTSRKFYNILKSNNFMWHPIYMPPTWNVGMLEYWNNGQKRITSVFGSRVLGSKKPGEWNSGIMESWELPSPNTPAIQYSNSPAPMA